MSAPGARHLQEIQQLGHGFYQILLFHSSIAHVRPDTSATISAIRASGSAQIQRPEGTLSGLLLWTGRVQAEVILLKPAYFWAFKAHG